MTENWDAVAQEVEDAMRSIGNTDEPDGHPATLRQVVTTPAPNPWEDPTETITYTTVRVLISDQELRDINGTLIGQVKRTVTISGANSVVPSDDDRIVLSMTKDEVESAGDANVAWVDIVTVKPLAPGGTAVLYDLTLQS